MLSTGLVNRGVKKDLDRDFSCIRIDDCYLAFCSCCGEVRIMTKQKFAEIILSRYVSLSPGDRFELFESLVLADNDLRNTLGRGCEANLEKEGEFLRKRVEDLEEFPEWAVNLSEILFQEGFELIRLDEMGEIDHDS